MLSSSISLIQVVWAWSLSVSSTNLVSLSYLFVLLFLSFSSLLFFLSLSAPRKALASRIRLAISRRTRLSFGASLLLLHLVSALTVCLAILILHCKSNRKFMELSPCPSNTHACYIGEIHITIKKGQPYDQWGIVRLALSIPNLRLKNSFDFSAQLYPGKFRCVGSVECLCLYHILTVCVCVCVCVCVW